MEFLPGNPNAEFLLARKLECSANGLAHLKQNLRVPPNVRGLKILDIGAGASTAAVELRKLGAYPVALDILYGNPAALRESSENYLEGFRRHLSTLPPGERGRIYDQAERNAQQFFRDFRRGDTRYVAGRARQLPFRNGAFDYAYSAACISAMLRDLDLVTESIMEAMRVLKPKGVLQISPWNGAPYVFDREDGVRIAFLESRNRPLLMATLERNGIESAIRTPQGRRENAFLELRRNR